MRKSVKRIVLAAVLVVLVALVVVAPASALSTTTKQVDPGWTVRTVWDNLQVATYKLPNGINHTGNIHMELTFKPNWADFDIYLLNASNQSLNEAQGYMATFTGKEVIDFNVTRVLNQTIEVDPYSNEQTMVGDTYYVVIVAFNETADFKIWGYYPQIDLSVGTAVNNPWNWYMQGYKKDWTKLKGAQYGYPYDFTPTSIGTGQAMLQWPANITNKTVDYDPTTAPMPANMEQYLYAGSNWNTVFEDYGPANWTPSQHGTDPNFWYGLLDPIDVTATGAAAVPLRTLHYIPSLFLVAANPMDGGSGDLKLGKSTMGFKTTLIYPENLRLKSAPAKVKKNAMATLKGSFALNNAWVAGASVKIQMSQGSGVWKTLKTVKTDANGNWVAKIKMTKAMSLRATAVGDATSGGLATEISITKRVKIS